MALNPIACTEPVVRSFLRYQLTAYPISDPHLQAHMRESLSLDGPAGRRCSRAGMRSAGRQPRQAGHGGTPIDRMRLSWKHGFSSAAEAKAT